MNNDVGNQKIIGESSFAGKYCKKHRCKIEDFEKDILWRCLSFSLAIPLTWLLLLVYRNFFQADLLLIARTKNATSFTEARDIVYLYSPQMQKSGTLGKWFKMRMSRRKLLSLANATLND